MDTALLDQILDPFSRCMDSGTVDRLNEFRISPAVQEKVEALAERANDGLLSDDERTQYEALVNAADFIAIIKLKARRRFNTKTA
jgi:hypothetical protein